MEIFYLIAIGLTLLVRRAIGQDVIEETVSLDSHPLISENNGADGYKFSYSTKGQSREEEGRFINGIWSVKGRVRWISEDGELHEVEYMADERGYRLLSPQPMEFPPLDVTPGIFRGLSPGALASLAG